MSFLLFTLVFISSAPSYANESISYSRLNKLSGDAPSIYGNKTIWDKRYSKTKYIYGKSPVKFLAENFGHIPSQSKILDIAMGEGRNAVFLARKNHIVTGIDISSVAIEKAKLLAKEHQVAISTVEASLETYKFKPQSFDVILNFYYVNRALNQKIVSWLRPGGLLMYEAKTLKHLVKKSIKTQNKDQYLRPGELLSMFPGMIILKYEEPLHDKDYRASIILKKKDL